MPGRVKAEYVVEIVPIGEPIKVGNFLYALVETRFINNDYFRLWHGWVITTSVKFYVNSITYPCPKQDAGFGHYCWWKGPWGSFQYKDASFSEWLAPCWRSMGCKIVLSASLLNGNSHAGKPVYRYQNASLVNRLSFYEEHFFHFLYNMCVLGARIHTS